MGVRGHFSAVDKRQTTGPTLRNDLETRLRDGADYTSTRGCASQDWREESDKEGPPSLRGGVSELDRRRIRRETLPRRPGDGKRLASRESSFLSRPSLGAETLAELERDV